MDVVTIVAVCGAFFVLAVISGGGIRMKRQSLIRKIQTLRRKRLEAEMGLQDMKEQLVLRASRVKALRQELESLRYRQEELREERIAKEAPIRTALDILVDMGRIGPDELHRAKEYLEKTKSESSVEEALVILGIVTPEDMNGAVRDAKHMAKAREHEKQGDEE